MSSWCCLAGCGWSSPWEKNSNKRRYSNDLNTNSKPFTGTNKMQNPSFPIWYKVNMAWNPPSLQSAWICHGRIAHHWMGQKIFTPKFLEKSHRTSYHTATFESLQINLLGCINTTVLFNIYSSKQTKRPACSFALNMLIKNKLTRYPWQGSIQDERFAF